MQQGFERRRAVRVAMLATAFCAVLPAVAAGTEVHTWTDENGTVHFSDAPSQSGESKTIDVGEVYRPGTTGAYPQPETTPTDSAAPAAAAEQKSYAQQQRDQRARARAKRREEQAEMDRQCQQYRELLARLEPSRRVYYTGANGETVRMDDEERVKRVEESKQFIAKNCR